MRLKLVIDATVLFTGLIGAGVTKEIIFSDLVKLYSPEYLFDEFEKHKSRIESLSGLLPEELNALCERLRKKINSVPKELFEDSFKQADSLISDKNDTEYLALSLAFNKMPIWSNDPHFKEQRLIEVFTTKELVERIKSEGYKFSTSA